MIDVVIPTVDRVVVLRRRDSGTTFVAAMQHVGSSRSNRTAFWWFTYTRRLGRRPNRPAKLPSTLIVLRAATGAESLAFLREVERFKKGVLQP